MTKKFHSIRIIIFFSHNDEDLSHLMLQIKTFIKATKSDCQTNIDKYRIAEHNFD